MRTCFTAHTVVGYSVMGPDAWGDVPECRPPSPQAHTEVLRGSDTDRVFNHIDGATTLNSRDSMRTARVQKVASARRDTKAISISNPNFPQPRIHFNRASLADMRGDLYSDHSIEPQLLRPTGPSTGCVSASHEAGRPQ